MYPACIDCIHTITITVVFILVESSRPTFLYAGLPLYIYISRYRALRARRPEEDQTVQARNSQVNMGVSYVSTDAGWQVNRYSPRPQVVFGLCRSQADLSPLSRTLPAGTRFSSGSGERGDVTIAKWLSMSIEFSNRRDLHAYGSVRLLSVPKAPLMTIPIRNSERQHPSRTTRTGLPNSCFTSCACYNMHCSLTTHCLLYLSWQHVPSLPHL